MDLTTLQQTVGNALKGTSFQLDGSALSAAVRTLFADVLVVPTLTLSDASVDATGSEPVAKGTLDAKALQPDFGLTLDLQATATFRLDTTQTPQVALSLSPPPSIAKGWGIPAAVPSFGNSVFAMFDWEDASLSFDSATPAALPTSFPTGYGFPVNSSATLASLRRGMAFSGTISYPGKDAALQLLFGSSAVPLSGPVEWYRGHPRMDLASAQLAELDFAGFQLPLDFHLVSLLPDNLLSPPKGVTATPNAVPLGVLHGELDRATLKIPFYVELYDRELQQVAVVGDFQDASSLALDEVAQLLGVGSLASQQSGSFPVLAGLALDTLVLIVDLPKQDLVSASATVGYTPPGGPWKPFGDLFAFDGMSVTFTAIPPLSSPSLETVVDATVTLAGGTLEGRLSLPDLTFSCELAENGAPIDLTEVLASIVGNVFGSFKLLCTELLVLGDYQRGVYRFQATVKDDPPWTFNIGSEPFGLTSIGFDITHSPAQTTGQVVAQVILAGVPVRISADYEGGAAGWAFSGGTIGPQSISLDALVDDALKLLGLSLPPNAPDVTITDVQMMFQTGNYDFGFSCDGRVTMGATEVGIGIDLGRTHDDPANPSQATTTFMGYLDIGASTFEVDFTLSPGSAGLKFSWTDTDKPLGFHDIAEFFGLDVPAPPENLDLSLTDAELFYDFKQHTLAVSATSKHYGRVVFVSFLRQPSPPGTRVNVFWLDVPLNLELGDLPLAGEMLPAGTGTSLGVKEVGAIYTSDQLQGSDVTAVNAVLATLGAPNLPAPTMASGFTFTLTVNAGAASDPIVLPLSQSTQKQLTAAQAVTPAGSSTPSAGAKWLSIDKTLGPVQLKRIGVQYEGGVLFFLFDASLSFSALQIGFSGLGAGSPLTDFDPKFHLDGLSVAFTAGPVEFSGGLLVVSQLPAKVDYEYVGEVSIGVKSIQITGFGAYARVEDDAGHGHPAFFLFAEVAGEFGGPPAFFVTGLMGGLGYNYALTIPTLDQVHLFPFLAGIDDSTVFGANPTPTSVLQVLSGSGDKPAWVTPQAGSYWGAAGVQFRSFELVLGRVLVVVTIARDVDIALLGLASVSLPQGLPETYAYVELQLEAVLEPEQGYFGVMASLTANSYVLTKACHLTGGFAFCLWFGSNEHAGDFVLTVGGYHPAFEKPDWYPVVAPVGFNWVVSSDIVVRGGAYFALTPSAAMAGGNLEATYQSGNLKAWFIAWANLLITWKPFHFSVGMGISIGASYRLNLLFTTKTITVELGASLTLWGPPTGGTAHVHWYIISFTVSFGAGETSGDDQTLDWPALQTLLPSASGSGGGQLTAAATTQQPAILDVKANSGLTSQDPNTGEWTVRADELSFTTSSAVPASAIVRGVGNDATAPLGAQPKASAGIQIRPMNLPAKPTDPGVTSTHQVTVTNLDDKQVQDLSTWAPAPQTLNMAGALWGAPLHGANPPPSAETVEGATGVRLTAPGATAGPTVGPVAIAQINDPLPAGPEVLDVAAQASAIPAAVADTASIAAIETAFANANVLATQAAQAQVLTALKTFAAAPPTSALTTGLGTRAGTQFAQPPMTVAG